MLSKAEIKQASRAALPVILGYIAIGIPCGILCSSIGMNVPQVLMMCALFYSGAGQFMIPNMWIAGNPIASIILSVSLVNTRQMLYSASLAPHCQKASRKLSFLFAATVTDESFGVNMARFNVGDWTVGKATAVNLFSQTSWTVSNIVGVLIGSAIGIPLEIAAFAMTSIFICLLVTQKLTLANILAAAFAMVGVFVCKLVGLGGPAILIGALVGVAAGMICARVARGGAHGTD